MRTAIALVVLIGLLVVGCATPETTMNLPKAADMPEDNRVAVPTGQVSQVVIKDNEFLPRTVEVSVGDTVEWVNTDMVEDEDTGDLEGVDHTISFDNGEFDQFLPSGTSVSHTFMEAGVYAYTSSLHQQAQGIVVVS